MYLGTTLHYCDLSALSEIYEQSTHVMYCLLDECRLWIVTYTRVPSPIKVACNCTIL